MSFKRHWIESKGWRDCVVFVTVPGRRKIIAMEKSIV